MGKTWKTWGGWDIWAGKGGKTFGASGVFVAKDAAGAIATFEAAGALKCPLQNGGGRDIFFG